MYAVIYGRVGTEASAAMTLTNPVQGLMIGTWLFGVPLGLAAAFVLHLSIPYVYFLLSLEECVRFGISVVVFRRRKWMQKLGQ